MKNLLLSILFLFSFVATFSQRNTGYVSISPNRYIFDSGIGLMYERRFTQFNSIASFLVGKYIKPEENPANHTVLSLGATKQVYQDEDYKVYLGGLVNYMGKISVSPCFEVKINRFGLLVSYNPFLKYSVVNFGYNF